MEQSAFKVYAFAEQEPVSEDFTLHANGVSVPLHLARVSACPFNRRWPGHQRPIDQTELASFALLQSSSCVEITLQPRRAFQQVVVRPLSKGVTPEVGNGLIRFTLPGPGAYTVELDGYHQALHLFVDPAVEYKAEPAKESVLYYGPGLHEAGCIELHTGQTLFLDEGAVVYARIFAKDADHIRILGHGILDGSHNKEKILQEIGEKEREQMRQNFAVTNAERLHTIQLDFCDDVRIEGITIRDSLVYNIRPVGCRDLQVENVKIIGNWRYNSDGIDMHNCERVVLRNCFVRTYDDSICIKGFDYTQDEAEMLHDGELHDVFTDALVENCVIWCDWGRSLEFGAETRAKEISRITFKNCDLIRNSAVACDVQNVDYADIHDVLFENIRVEYDPVSQPMKMQNSEEEVYVEDPASTYMPQLLGSYVREIPEYSQGKPRRGKNRNIVFKNIYVTAPSMPPSEFVGYDAEHESGPIHIDGLYLNGTRLSSLEEANLTVNSFVSDVTFQ